MKKVRDFSAGMGFVAAIVLMLVLVFCMAGLSMAEGDRQGKDPATVEGRQSGKDAKSSSAKGGPAGKDAAAKMEAQAKAEAQIKAEAEAMLKEAAALQEKGEAEKAAALYGKIISRFPDKADAYWYRANIYYQQQKYELAKADFKKVISLVPQFGDAYGMLGWRLIEEGKFVEAKPLCEKAHELNPESYAFAVNLGHIYLLTGDAKKAREYYRQSLPLIKTDQEFTKGPQADFELFIKNGWQAVAARQELSWMQGEWEKTKKLREAEKLKGEVVKLYDAGKYKEAIEVADKALLLVKTLGKENNDVATALHCRRELALFWMYRDKPDYAKAKSLLSDCFRICTGRQNEAAYKEVIENTDSTIGQLRSKRYNLYQAGKYKEAIEPAERVLSLEEALGKDHIDIAKSLGWLASVYKSAGHYAEAEPLYKRSLAISEKALGPNDLDVATSLNNLAGLYRATGRYGEAEPLYKRSLAINEKALGPDHPDVAGSLNNLAALYVTTGRYAEAEPLFKRSLAMDEKALGPAHPDLATSLSNLAVLYDTTGQYAEVEPLYKRSLAIREKALGLDHPDVAQSLNNLAALYRITGRYSEAEPLYKRSLAITEKSLGPDHANVALSLNNLAALYYTIGRYGEAEPLYKRSLAIYEKALGPYHPDVATSLNNLAGLYESTGRYSEAEPLYKRSLAIYEKSLGPDHPYVATSLNNLAELYRTTGRYGEAEPLYKRSLAIAQGAGDPRILYHIQSGYSSLLAKENQPEAAIFFAKQAVNTIQGIRGNVARMDKETQKAYQGTVEDVYKRLSGLLIDAGRLSEAQQVMDLLKQEEYFEFVRRDAQEASAVSGRAALTVRETDANKQYQAASVALAKLSVERGALVEKGKKAPLTTDEDALLARIDTKLEAAGKAFQQTIDDITTELSRSRKEKSEQIREAQGLQEDLRELGNGAVAIYTLAGEKKFRLLLITPDFQRAYEYPITEKELNRKVSDFRAALTPKGGRLQDPLPLAQELYKIILGPAAADLQTVKAETLMWSLDGSLRYLPVAALHDGRQYLVATYPERPFHPGQPGAPEGSARCQLAGPGPGGVKRA